MRRFALALVTLLLVPSIAGADELDDETPPEPDSDKLTLQPAAAAAVTPAPAPAPAPTAATDIGAALAPTSSPGIVRRSRDDAAVHRAYLSPTALMGPAGSAQIDVRAPLLPGGTATASVSLTDWLEVGAVGVYVIDEDPALGLHAKLQLFRTDTAAVAVAVDALKLDFDDDETLLIPSLSASFCADGDECRTLVTAHIDGAFVHDEDDNFGEPERILVPGVSLIHGRKHKFIAELHTFRDGNDSIFAGFVGFRLVSMGAAAFDLGLGFAGAVDDELDAIPWPFFGLTHRM
jgi:hypothetical protein